MKVQDIMSINAIRIMQGATLAEAAELAAISNASGMVVVDSENNFKGVLSESDLIEVLLPTMSDVIERGDDITVSYNLFEEKGKKLANETIDHYLIKDPITVSPDDEVLRVASTMAIKKMRRLPVVDKGKLLGTVSRGDICRAIIHS